MQNNTDAKREVALQIVAIVGDCIKELGSVPSGHLYAQLMGKLSLDNYNAIISTLKRIGYVKETGHVLTWIKK